MMSYILVLLIYSKNTSMLILLRADSFVPLKPHNGFIVSCNIFSSYCICLKALEKIISVALPISTRTLWIIKLFMLQLITIVSLCG